MHHIWCSWCARWALEGSWRPGRRPRWTMESIPRPGWMVEGLLRRRSGSTSQFDICDSGTETAIYRFQVATHGRTHRNGRFVSKLRSLVHCTTGFQYIVHSRNPPILGQNRSKQASRMPYKPFSTPSTTLTMPVLPFLNFNRSRNLLHALYLQPQSMIL